MGQGEVNYSCLISNGFLLKSYLNAFSHTNLTTHTFEHNLCGYASLWLSKSLSADSHIGQNGMVGLLAILGKTSSKHSRKIPERRWTTFPIVGAEQSTLFNKLFLAFVILPFCVTLPFYCERVSSLRICFFLKHLNFIICARFTRWS